MTKKQAKVPTRRELRTLVASGMNMESVWQETGMRCPTCFAYGSEPAYNRPRYSRGQYVREAVYVRAECETCQGSGLIPVQVRLIVGAGVEQAVLPGVAA